MSFFKKKRESKKEDKTVFPLSDLLYFMEDYYCAVNKIPDGNQFKKDTEINIAEKSIRNKYFSVDCEFIRIEGSNNSYKVIFKLLDTDFFLSFTFRPMGMENWFSVLEEISPGQIVDLKFTISNIISKKNITIFPDKIEYKTK